jgi:type IV pilus assembly protein PilP
MIKRRSDNPLLKGGVLFLAVIALVSSGCKKESPLPPPAKVTPLPKKPDAQPVSGGAVTTPNAPGAANAPAAAKAVLTKPTSAKQSPVKNPAQAQISSAGRVAKPAEVSLDFTNRRDPFKPYAQVPAHQPGVQAKGAKGTKGKVKDPLPIQKFDAERYKITGIIAGMKENSALIVDPSGKGFVIKVGMLVGNNDGVVKRITANSVEIEETFRDDNGKSRKRTVKLALLSKK